MSINPLNDISKVYLEQVASVDEMIRNPESRKKLRDIEDREVRKGDKSKGENPRSKYPTKKGKLAGHLLRGPESTGSPGNPVRSRGGTNAPADERVGKGSARAGNAAYWASVAGPTRDRGAGNKAARRAGKSVANTRDFDEEFEIDETSHLETDMKKRLEANEKAIEDMKKTKAHKDMVAAARKKFDEAAKPDYLDFDKDGNEKESMKKALRDKAKKKMEEAAKPNDGNLANNYPPYDKVTRGDVIAGRLGKDQMGGKKKVAKEAFSNWREDLIEVVDKISKDKSADVKITEKQVDNKIDINPKLDLGETVENLGGTLLEMVEIDEVDYIVESVYDELLDEGYGEDDIEEAIEFALSEAKVTFGHDTPTGQKKRGNLVAAVGRLARQKLSSKVRGAKKAAKQAVATGARKVAKGALGVARKMEGGDKKPATTERKPSTYRGAGAGTKEKVSSGSYTPPTKKKAEKPADPWEGSATTPPKAKAKPKAATKKAAAPKPKAPAKKKKSSNLDNLLASIRNESVIGDRARNAVADDRLSSEQERTDASMGKLRAQTKRHEKSTALARTQASIAAKKSEDTARAMHPKPGVRGHRIEEVQINEMPYQVMGSPDGKNEKKIGKPVKSRRYADARAAELEDTHKKTGGKYRSQYVEEVGMIDEKTLTAAEKAKKEEIFKSLKAKRKDFESRYPGRGEEVMHGVATNIAKKIAEQAMEIQPKSSQSGQKDQTQKKLAQQKDRQRQQEVQILQRKLQTLRSAPKGVDTDITA